MRSFFKPLSLIIAVSSLSIACNAIAMISADRIKVPADVRIRVRAFLPKLTSIAKPSPDGKSFIIKRADFKKVCPNAPAFEPQMKDSDYPKIYGGRVIDKNTISIAKRKLRLFAMDHARPCTQTGYTPFPAGAIMFVNKFAKPVPGKTNLMSVRVKDLTRNNAYSTRRAAIIARIIAQTADDKNYRLTRQTMAGVDVIVGRRADLVRAIADGSRKIRTTKDEFKKVMK